MSRAIPIVAGCAMGEGVEDAPADANKDVVAADKESHPFEVPSTPEHVEVASPRRASGAVEGASSTATASTSGPETPRGKTRGRSLWDRTILRVLLSIGVSRQFRTLRDHEGADIKKKDLQHIGVLGQGEDGQGLRAA